MHPDNGNFAETASVETLLRELEALKNDKNELEEKRYIDARMAAFVEILRWRLDDTLNRWADRVLTEIIQSVDGLQGAFYVASDDTATLKLAASYAAPPETPQTVEPGVGVSGQAVKTRQARYFENQDTFYSFNYSSLSRIQAQALSITPLVYNEQVEGLLELSAARPFERRALDLIKSLSDSVAANLSTISNQEKIQRLYREAQDKSNALTTQEEELRQNLEELQATQEQMRLARQEIERSTHFIETALNSTSMIFVATDHEGVIRFMNEAAVQGFGYSLEETIGILTPATFHDLGEIAEEAARLSEVEGIFVPPGFDVFKALPYRGEKYQREWTFTRKNGEKFPGELTVSGWRAPDGTYNGLIGLVQDITDKKIVQEELDRQSYELKKNFEALSVAQEKMREAQDAIRLQSEQLTGVINNINGIIYLIGPDLSLQLYNEAFRQLLADNGITLYAGMPVREFVAPAEYDKLTSLIKRAFAGENVYEEISYKFEGLDQTKYFDVSYTPYKNTDGETIGVVLFTREITERKLLEVAVQQKNEELEAQSEELRQNLEELAATQEQMREAQRAIQHQSEQLLGVMNNITGVLSLTGPDLRLQLYNENFRQLLAANGIVVAPGMHFRDYINPAEYDKVVSFAERALLGESFYEELAYQFEGSDQTVYYAVSYTPYKNAVGEILGVVSFTQDITTRIRQEKEVARSRDNIQSIISSIDGQIICVDPHFNILYFNQAATFSMPAIAVGVDMATLVDPAVWELYTEARARAVSGIMFAEEIEYELPGVGLQHLRINYIPIKDADGLTRQVLIHSYDITERKELELSIQEKNEELESQSEELRQNLEELAFAQRAVENERARLLSIADNIEGNIALFDPEYRLTFFNEGWRNAFTSSGDAPPQNGMHVRDFIGPETHDWFMESIDRALNGESFSVEIPYKFIENSDETYYYLTSWSPHKDASGKIVGALILGRNITERIRQEQEIIRSRDAIQSIINSIDGQIMCVDTNYNILYFNDKSTTSMPGIAVGVDMSTLIAPEEWARHADARARSVNGETFSEEFRYELPGAGTFHFRINYIPMRNADGVVNQILIHTYDITERKELELTIQRKNEELESQSEELRQNLEELSSTQEQMQAAQSAREQETIRLSGVVNNLNGMVYLLDENKNLAYYNESFAQALESTENKPYVGMNLAAFVTDPAQFAFISTMVAKALSGEAVLEEMDFEIPNTDQIASFSLNYSPYRDSTGKIAGVMCFAQDITARRTAERKAEAVAQQKQAEIAVVSARNQEQASVLQLLEFTFLIAEFDLEGNFIRANDNYARLLGYSSEELIGQNYSVILPRDYAETEPYKQFWQNLKAGKTYKGEVLRIRKDGHRVWLQAAYKPIFNAEGGVYKILQMAHDATRNPKP